MKTDYSILLKSMHKNCTVFLFFYLSKMLSFNKQIKHKCNKLWIVQHCSFSKYRKIRYRRKYGIERRGEPKTMPKTRTKMFVPTHIAHKYDWSPVDRIWSMRASMHDSIDHESLTSLIKETSNSVDLLDVIGLSLRRHKRQIQWKPYHSSVAIHHLAQLCIAKKECIDKNNRFLWDLLEECAVSVTVLKPRFIAQTMWSLDKLQLIDNNKENETMCRGKLCLLKCADALNDNPLIHKLEIWNVADSVNVLTKNKMYNHPLIWTLSQRVINMKRDNEYFQINDIGQSYSILAHSFGKIIRFRNIDNNNGDPDNIDYHSLCFALIERFMDDQIYKSSNNFEILNFLKGIGNIMDANNSSFSFFVDGLKKLEMDLYENMEAMHIKDIAIITNAFLHCVDKEVLLRESMWFGQIISYLDNFIKQDAFSLLDIDERVQCLHYFINIMTHFLADDGKESKYYHLYSKYIEEVFRAMDIFNDLNEKYQDQTDNDMIYDYNKNSKVITDFIQIFDKLTSFHLRDKHYFLFEQKFAEILCGFLQSETRLFSQISWRKLISLQSGIDLLYLLLRRSNDGNGLNVNILRTVFVSMEYHILESDHCQNTQNMIKNDINSSRHLINKLFEVISIFHVFQSQRSELLVDDEDNTTHLISDKLKEYFVNILLNEYENKYHFLSQKDRKNVLRALLVLSEQNIEQLMTDFNRFAFYKGTKAALLTQTIDANTEINGYLLGKQIKSDIFRNFLQKNGLFISNAFVLNEDNVFRIKNLNEWRFQRLEQHKMVNTEQMTEDGKVRGRWFEWRAGGKREGAGIHPTLNDADLDELEMDDNEYEDTFNEDNALLTSNENVDYKKIILRSICDILLERNHYNDNMQPIAIFMNTNNATHDIYNAYYQQLCDLFDAKCVIIDDLTTLNDTNAICNEIRKVC